MRRVTMVLTLGMLMASLGAHTAAVGDDPGPGCDPSRPAVAHYADREVLDSQPPGAPIPCMTIAGPAIEAATVGVTNTNTVFFASIDQVPLNNIRAISKPSTVARSTDLGATWEFKGPGTTQYYSGHGSLSTWLSVDPRTSRVWYATPTAPCGARISWSDNDGESWTSYPNVGCPAQGAAVLMEGPPPAGAPPVESAYPHVVYYCANSADVGANARLMCFKSRNGGDLWLTIGSPDPLVEEPCSDSRTRGGIVASDGTLYFPTECGSSGLGLAVSRDEGATWERTVTILETTNNDLYPPAMAVDADDNLYIAWRGEGNLPYVIISRDGGETWSDPIMIGAPEVTSYRRIGIVARSPGHILVSYLGTGPEGINAYMTESRNALDEDPVFWSAAVNPPETPVYSTGSETFGNRMWFLRGHIADDGTPWAGFHCFNTAPMCPNSDRLGLVGRLAPG